MRNVEEQKRRSGDACQRVSETSKRNELPTTPPKKQTSVATFDTEDSSDPDNPLSREPKNTKMRTNFSPSRIRGKLTSRSRSTTALGSHADDSEIDSPQKPEARRQQNLLESTGDDDRRQALVKRSRAWKKDKKKADKKGEKPEKSEWRAVGESDPLSPASSSLDDEGGSTKSSPSSKSKSASKRRQNKSSLSPPRSPPRESSRTEFKKSETPPPSPRRPPRDTFGSTGSPPRSPPRPLPASCLRSPSRALPDSSLGSLPIPQSPPKVETRIAPRSLPGRGRKAASLGMGGNQMDTKKLRWNPTMDQGQVVPNNARSLTRAYRKFEIKVLETFRGILVEAANFASEDDADDTQFGATLRAAKMLLKNCDANLAANSDKPGVTLVESNDSDTSNQSQDIKWEKVDSLKTEEEPERVRKVRFDVPEPEANPERRKKKEDWKQREGIRIYLLWNVAVANICTYQILQRIGGPEGNNLPDLSNAQLLELVKWIESFIRGHLDGTQKKLAPSPPTPTKIMEDAVADASEGLDDDSDDVEATRESSEVRNLYDNARDADNDDESTFSNYSNTSSRSEGSSRSEHSSRSQGSTRSSGSQGSKMGSSVRKKKRKGTFFEGEIRIQDMTDNLVWLKDVLWEIQRLAQAEYLQKTRDLVEELLDNAYTTKRIPTQLTDGTFTLSLSQDVFSFVSVQLDSSRDNLCTLKKDAMVLTVSLLLTQLRRKHGAMCEKLYIGRGLEYTCAAANDFYRMSVLAEEIFLEDLPKKTDFEEDVAQVLEESAMELIMMYGRDAVRAAKMIHVSIFDPIVESGVPAQLFGPRWASEYTHNQLALTVVRTMEDYMRDIPTYLCDGLLLRKMLQALVSATVVFYVKALLVKAESHQPVTQRNAPTPGYFNDTRQALIRMQGDIAILKGYFEGLKKTAPSLSITIESEFPFLTVVHECMGIAHQSSFGGGSRTLADDVSNFVFMAHKLLGGRRELTSHFMADLWHLVNPSQERSVVEVVESMKEQLDMVVNACSETDKRSKLKAQARKLAPATLSMEKMVSQLYSHSQRQLPRVNRVPLSSRVAAKFHLDWLKERGIGGDKIDCDTSDTSGLARRKANRAANVAAKNDSARKDGRKLRHRGSVC